MGNVTKIIVSYKNRIAMVEDLMKKAHQATMASQGGLDILNERRERLKADLCRIMAKNGASNKADLDRLLEKALVNSTRRRIAIENERIQIRVQVEKFLDDHKQLADYLRRRLTEPQLGNADDGTLDAMLGIFKTRYEDMGRRLVAGLREFRSNLRVFLQEQEEINTRMQKLVHKGRRLCIEDLNQLEAFGAGREADGDTGLQSGEVDRRLTYIRQQRLEYRCN